MPSAPVLQVVLLDVSCVPLILSRFLRSECLGIFGRQRQPSHPSTESRFFSKPLTPTFRNMQVAVKSSSVSLLANARVSLKDRGQARFELVSQYIGIPALGGYYKDTLQHYSVYSHTLP